MAIRMLEDTEGKVWRVWHVVPQSDVLRSAAPGMASGWLCFENDGDKRRLANPPAAWREISNEELLALFASAAPVTKLNTR